MRSTAIRLVAAGFLALSAILAATSTLVPVTLTALDGVSQQSVSAGLWERQAEPVATRIVLRAKGPVRFTPPTLTWPQRFHSKLITNLGGFQFDAESGQFVADGGAPMIVRGYLADFTVVLAPGSTGELRVKRQSVTATEQTEATSSRPTAELPSPQQTYSRVTSFAWRDIPAGLDDPAVAHLSARVGGTELELEGMDYVPLRKAAGPAVAQALRGWTVFLLAGALLVGCWILGSALDPSDSGSTPRQAGRMAVGFSVSAVLMNTLAYWIPAAWAAWVLTLCAAILVALRMMRTQSGSARLPGLGAVGALIGLASIPAAVLFFPTLLWGLQYAGEYKTDLFEYMNLASIVRGHSLLAMQELPEAQAAGGLTAGAGTTWRSIDSVTASGLSTVLPIPTIGAFALLGIVLFGMYATALLALRQRLQSGWAGDVIVLLSLLAPAFTGLFLEDYLSHYFFVALVPPLLLLLALRLDAWPRRDAYLTVAIGVVAAALGASYPYFLVMVGIGLLAALIASRDRIRAAVQIGPTILVTTLVAMNLALLTVFNYGKTEALHEALNDIARYVLLAPYSPAQQALLAAGFVPYEWRGWSTVAAPAMGTPGEQIWRAASSAYEVGPWALAVPAAFLVAVLAAVAWDRSLRDPGFAGALGMVLVWGAFAAFQLTQSSPYAAFKVTWTAVALAPMILATTIWRSRRSRVVLVCLIVMAGMWLRAGAADRVHWLLPGANAVRVSSHASIVEDLQGAAAELGGARSMVMFKGEAPIAGSDRDRVAAAHVSTLARDMGIDCVNCDNGNGAASIDDVTCPTAADVVVLVGASGRSEVCGKPRVYDGGVVEVYRQQVDPEG